MNPQIQAIYRPEPSIKEENYLGLEASVDLVRDGLPAELELRTQPSNASASTSFAVS